LGFKGIHFCRFRKNEDGKYEVGLNFWFWPAWLPVENDDSSSCAEENARFVTAGLTNKSGELEDVEILLTCELKGLNTYVRSYSVHSFLAIKVCNLSFVPFSYSTEDYMEDFT
jgi:hypothetical protein